MPTLRAYAFSGTALSGSSSTRENIRDCPLIILAVYQGTCSFRDTLPKNRSGLRFSVVQKWVVRSSVLSSDNWLTKQQSTSTNSPRRRIPFSIFPSTPPTGKSVNSAEISRRPESAPQSDRSMPVCQASQRFQHYRFCRRAQHYEAAWHNPMRTAGWRIKPVDACRPRVGATLEFFRRNQFAYELSLVRVEDDLNNFKTVLEILHFL